MRNLFPLILACSFSLGANAAHDTPQAEANSSEPTPEVLACAARAKGLSKEPDFIEFFKKMAVPARLNTAKGAKEYLKQAKPVVAASAATLASAASSDRAAWLVASEMSQIGATPEDEGPNPIELCTNATKRLQGKAPFADLLLTAIKGPVLSASAAAFDSVLREQFLTTYNARRTEAIGTITFNEGDRKSLNDEELTAIYSYTLGDYRPLNRALRSKDPNQIMLFKPYVDLMEAGLKKLPPYSGPLTRIDTLPEPVLKQHVPGAELTYDAFTSTTEGHVTGKTSAQVLYIKANGKGHILGGISFWPTEKEVLYPPGTRFKVISVKPSAEEPDTTEIEMEELP